VVLDPLGVDIYLRTLTGLFMRPCRGNMENILRRGFHSVYHVERIAWYLPVEGEIQQPSGENLSCNPLRALCGIPQEVDRACMPLEGEMVGITVEGYVRAM